MEIQQAATDALENAQKDCDDQQRVMMIVERSMADLSKEECDIDTKVLTPDTFKRLCLSNDWNFAIIDELEADLVTKQE